MREGEKSSLLLTWEILKNLTTCQTCLSRTPHRNLLTWTPESQIPLIKETIRGLSHPHKTTNQVPGKVRTRSSTMQVPKLYRSCRKRTSKVWEAEYASRNKNWPTLETTHTAIKIPRRSFLPPNHVTISVPMGTESESSKISLCLADVRLGSLPNKLLWQRMWGNIRTIYVKGVPRATLVSPIASRRSSIRVKWVLSALRAGARCTASRK